MTNLKLLPFTKLEDDELSELDHNDYTTKKNKKKPPAASIPETPEYSDNEWINAFIASR